MNDKSYEIRVAEHLAIAEKYYPNWPPYKQQEWAELNAAMRLCGTHLLTGKKWYRGPTVLR